MDQQIQSKERVSSSEIYENFDFFSTRKTQNLSSNHIYSDYSSDSRKSLYREYVVYEGEEYFKLISKPNQNSIKSMNQSMKNEKINEDSQYSSNKFYHILEIGKGDQFYDFYNQQHQISIKIQVSSHSLLCNYIEAINNQQNIPPHNNSMDFQLPCFHLKQDELIMIRANLKKMSMYLEKMIGKGGEADVYLGYIVNNEGKKVEVVFRIIKLQDNKQIETARQQFKKLIEIAYPKNIIQYDGLIEIKNILIFVLKKYNKSLQSMMNEKISNTIFLKISLDLIYGLMEFRMNSIIHSDIKPSNILFNENQKFMYSDFGMSLKLKNKDKQINQIGYSFQYCSPEHLNSMPISYASDMYSLGKLLMKLSENLEDKQFFLLIQIFLKENLIQEDPEQRIKHESLFPLFTVLLIQSPLRQHMFHFYMETQFLEDILQKRFQSSLNQKVTREIVFSIQQSFWLMLQDTKKYMSFESDQDKIIGIQINLAKAFLILNKDMKHLKIQFPEQFVQDLQQSYYNFKSLKECDPQIKEELELKLNFFLGEAYYYSNMLDLSIQYYSQGLELFQQQEIKQINQIQDFYLGIAQSYHKSNNFDKAYYFVTKCIQVRLQNHRQIDFEVMAFKICYSPSKEVEIESYQELFEYFRENKLEDIQYDKKYKSLRSEHQFYFFIDGLKILKEFSQCFKLAFYWLKKRDELQRENDPNIILDTEYFQEKNIGQQTFQDNIFHDLMKLLPTQERDNLLTYIMKKKLDYAQKNVLIDFAFYYYLKLNNIDQVNKIFEVFFQNKEQLSISRQIKIYLLFAQFRINAGNTEKAKTYMQRAYQLLNNPNLIEFYRQEDIQIFFITISISFSKMQKEIQDKNKLCIYENNMNLQLLSCEFLAMCDIQEDKDQYSSKLVDEERNRFFKIDPSLFEKQQQLKSQENENIQEEKTIFEKIYSLSKKEQKNIFSKPDTVESIIKQQYQEFQKDFQNLGFQMKDIKFPDLEIFEVDDPKAEFDYVVISILDPFLKYEQFSSVMLSKTLRLLKKYMYF